MGIVTGAPSYETIRVRYEDDFCHLQLFRPQADNAINDRMIAECREVIAACRDSVKILILEGLPEVFCFGADFKEMSAGHSRLHDAGPLYDLWLGLATGPFVSVAHVTGKVNAGGVGFVAACDIVICHEKVVFSLSELLFGLLPACVLPFLTRRIGAAHVNYMTLMTQPITAQQAFTWGLVDAIGEDQATNQPRRAQRPFRMRRHFHQVNVRVQQPGMVPAARPLHLGERSFEHDDGFFGVGLRHRRARVDAPELPWCAAEQRIGEQRGDVWIIGVCEVHRPHRIGVFVVPLHEDGGRVDAFG